MRLNTWKTPLSEIDRPARALLAAWALTMIALPIAGWTLGQAALQQGIILGVLVQAAAVIVILLRGWGAGRTLAAALIILPAAWAAEYLGSATGFPFGHYDYTPVLQPQLGGVPLLIPLAWLMMLPPAWAVAARLAARARYPRLAFILAAALAFTAWDLFLDPQMVAWNFWVWAQPGGYFGIPWVNYLGWLLVSGTITALVSPLIFPPDGRVSRRLPDMPLLAVYAITWALETIGLGFFWGLPGPALVGFLGMGALLAAALLASPLRSPRPADGASR